MTRYEPKTTPWQVNQHAFPSGPPRERNRFLLNYAILAPSSHNSQPWKFAVNDQQIEVFGDFERWLPVADTEKRELYISVGCALENLLIAAEHFGMGFRVELMPDLGNPTHIANVRLGSEHPVEPLRPQTLFPMIRVRHTNHKEYDGRPLEDDVLDRLKGLRGEEGVLLHFFRDLSIRKRIDEMLVAGDAVQFADPDYRKELGYWIGQGVFGASWLMSKLEKLAVTYVNVGESQARRDSTVLMSSPAIAVLSSTANEPSAWIRVGQVYQRLCLLAASLGIWTQPISQIVEVPELRADLSELLPVGDVFAQHPFRLGYAEPEAEHTPRRPLDDVLLEPQQIVEPPHAQ